jgi:D-alanine-D-alanine ligase
VSKRILIIAHKDLVPPQSINEEPDRFNTDWITEYDVKNALIELGHEVEFVGILDSIDPLLEKISDFKPHCVFNLLEEFNFDSQSDFKIIALLEMMKIKFTGCNSKGLLLARDKALSKKILKHHRIGTPHFFTLPKNKKRKLPKSIKYPVIVKCLFEEASLGIAQASICHSKEKLLERAKYIHEKLDQDAIVEEFIEGKEIYVGIKGDIKLQNLPLWELKFENVDQPEKEIYSSRAKWNEKYRKRKGIINQAAELDSTISEKIIKVCKKTYQVLELSGYARIDLRLTENGDIYILEANPNPNIAKDDEFANSAASIGINYTDLIKNLLPV